MTAEGLGDLATVPGIGASDSARERDEIDHEQLGRWMRGYQAGDISAFENLYRAMAPRLKSYLMWNCLDESRAEDLLQETFLQVHRSRHTYLPERPVRPWLYSIARHVFLSDRRSSRRRNREDGLDASVINSLSNEFSTTKSHEKIFLTSLLAKLDAKKRLPLILHHFWGFGFDDVSSMLGISRSAAKVRSFRALKELRASLEHHHG